MARKRSVLVYACLPVSLLLCVFWHWEKVLTTDTVSSVTAHSVGANREGASVAASAAAEWSHSAQQQQELLVELKDAQLHALLTHKQALEAELRDSERHSELLKQLLVQRELELRQRDQRLIDAHQLLRTRERQVRRLHLQGERQPLTYAVYRVLYGSEFIRHSIESVLDYVDKVFVCWTDRTWADVKGAHFNGKWESLPSPIDSIAETVLAMRSGKIELIYDHVNNNTNQITHIVNDIILPKHRRPDLIIFLEWDHVWRRDQLELALSEFAHSGKQLASSQVLECYRTPRYLAKPRDWRYGTMFWNMTLLGEAGLPATGMHADVRGAVFFLRARMHNLGLCASPALMRTKFLIALAFSLLIGDSPPDELWYNHWLAFDINDPNTNQGLEMAKGFRDDLPYAEEYNVYELPENVRLALLRAEFPHWAEYERLHPPPPCSVCDRALLAAARAPPALDAQLQRYVQLHAAITDAHSSEPIVKRYVVVRNWPEAGLGNRLQVIVSAFLFALVTDRALLVDWPADGVMEHFNKEELIAMIELDELFSEPGMSWNYKRHAALLRYKLGTQTSYGGEHGYRGDEPAFQCADYRLAFPELVVYFRADQYFALNIAINPFYREYVLSTFAGGDVFGPLARFLFHPAPDIMREILLFKSLYFGDYTLGLQIRKVGGSKLNDQQEEIFWDCALTASTANEDASKVVWFLATDNYATRTLARKRYGSKVVFYDRPISRSDANGIKAGIIDMWLLSMTDHLIVSAASTYGRISYGMRGKPPSYVNQRNECQARDSWQPCFFRWRPAPCFEALTDSLATLPVSLHSLIDVDCNNV